MSSKINLDNYLDKLAEASPVPGGGSAAALIGAIGMSLLSMVIKYVLKRNDKGISHAKLFKILEFTEHSRHRLRELMDKDEAAYLRLSKGRRGGKKDMAPLYKGAAEVPLEVCAIIQGGLKKCEELCACRKTSLVSDLAEASIILETGFLSAKFNVEINLGGIKDAAYTKRVRTSLLRQKAIVYKIKNNILRKTKMC
jgi:formiminotetrahydrofolate cyclodeaminase